VRTGRVIDTRETFLIDGTGLFAASHKAFLGVPVLVVDAEDYTFVFGVIKALLQLRQSFGIARGLFVIGGEAHKVTSIVNVERTATFLKQLGIPVVHDPVTRVLDLSLKLAPLVTYVATHDRNLLLLAAYGRRILLLKEGSESEVYGCETVLSKCGVRPDLVPAFLALTDGPPLTTLSKGEAIALLEHTGDLAAVIADPSRIPSRHLRSKLRVNGEVILQRFQQWSPSGCCPRPDLNRRDLEIDVDNDRAVAVLAAHGFHSLRRLLPRPGKVDIVTGETKPIPSDYHAIITHEDLRRLVTVLEMKECCTLDTESSGKDPHTAELFGISISVKKGEAFYVPTAAHDLSGIDRSSVVSVLRRLLAGSIKVTGHNLKYDYVLLRKHGIEIANVDFDTMLAAYDCFGDSDTLNLQYLAKRYLGRTIKSHGEIVPANESLLDLPFRDVVDYACTHADVTLQLGDVLRQELAQRGIEQQYRDETLTMVKTLSDWEVDGIPVDLDRLCSGRDSLADLVSRTKDAVINEVGGRFNVDSAQEVVAVLRMDPIVAKVVGFRRISLGALEELAIAHKVPRLLVRYNRCEKRLRYLEAVCQSVQNGRVHPVFSQTRTDHCRLSSVKPRLLDIDSAQDLASYLPDGVRQFCPDARGALGILADAAADNVLQGDLLAAKGSYSLQDVHPLDEDGDLHLLLSVVVGVSDHQICRMFLLDRSTLGAICHEFRTRYSLTFMWLEGFRNETATNGYASAYGRRRYLDGLRSSNLEKRDKAMRSAIRWRIQW
jgi:DNA polymerase-1